MVAVARGDHGVLIRCIPGFREDLAPESDRTNVLKVGGRKVFHTFFVSKIVDVLPHASGGGELVRDDDRFRPDSACGPPARKGPAQGPSASRG